MTLFWAVFIVLLAAILGYLRGRHVEHEEAILDLAFLVRTGVLLENKQHPVFTKVLDKSKPASNNRFGFGGHE